MHEQELNAALLEAFRAQCPEDDRRVVFGEGVWEHPPVLLIGEAPGAQESEQGRPFVGKAGQNLNEFLAVLDLERPQIRITNVVKVRPFRVSEKGTVANRPPNRQELAFFTPWLHREIALTQPGLIVTLGNTALQALLPGTVIGSCHGAVTGAVCEGTAYRLFPLYHPASIIYNRALADTYREDLIRLKQVLDAHT